MVAAHPLSSGLAELLGDRNFAVFSVAWAAQSHGQGVLFRLTEARGRLIVGRVVGEDGKTFTESKRWS